MAVQFQDTKKPLSEMLAEIANSIQSDTITIRELITRVGEQGLLLVCMFLTIPFLLPLMIPGVSTVFGAVIILISIGVILNRIPWMPKFLADRQFDSQGIKQGMERGGQLLTRVDRIIKPRLRNLTDGAVMSRVNGFALLLGGVLLIFPFGGIPLTNTLPGWGILLLCAGILQRDGLLVLLSYLLFIASIIYFAALILGALAVGQGVLSLFRGS